MSRIFYSPSRIFHQAKLLPRIANARFASTSALLDIGQRHVTKGLGRLVDGIVKKGTGSYLHMEDGRRLLDFTCGIGVTSLGAYLPS
jgi:4-aminobutyrate aminotransferase